MQRAIPEKSDSIVSICKEFVDLDLTLQEAENTLIALKKYLGEAVRILKNFSWCPYKTLEEFMNHFEHRSLNKNEIYTLINDYFFEIQGDEVQVIQQLEKMEPTGLKEFIDKFEIKRIAVIAYLEKFVDSDCHVFSHFLSKYDGSSHNQFLTSIAVTQSPTSTEVKAPNELNSKDKESINKIHHYFENRYRNGRPHQFLDNHTAMKLKEKRSASIYKSGQKLDKALRKSWLNRS